MRQHFPFLAMACALGVTSSATAGAVDAPHSPAEAHQVREVAQWLSGSFSSRQQAQTNAQHHEVELHVRPIWTARTDGHWLYVEQALADSLSKPYRQRIYHIGWDGEGPVSDVFNLPGDASRFVGTWDPAKPFPDLAPALLVARAGCSIHLHKETDGTYRGGTAGKDCASERSGARYATSQVTLAERFLESWDRGFDAQDQQAWGAPDGPYRFDRIP